MLEEQASQEHRAEAAPVGESLSPTIPAGLLRRDGSHDDRQPARLRGAGNRRRPMVGPWPLQRSATSCHACHVSSCRAHVASSWAVTTDAVVASPPGFEAGSSGLITGSWSSSPVTMSTDFPADGDAVEARRSALDAQTEATQLGLEGVVLRFSEAAHCSRHGSGLCQSCVRRATTRPQPCGPKRSCAARSRPSTRPPAPSLARCLHMSEP